MGPKNRATNWHYNRFGTISDGTITGMHCTSLCYDNVHRSTLDLKGGFTLQKKRASLPSSFPQSRNADSDRVDRYTRSAERHRNINFFPRRPKRLSSHLLPPIPRLLNGTW